MKKVLFFFPHKPYPPQFGAHKRCIQLLNGLRSLGCRIKFTSSAYRTDAWTDMAVNEFAERFGCEVGIFRPTLVQRGFSAGIDYMKKMACLGEELPQHLTSSYGRSWFSQVSNEFEPDVLFINYANYDALVDWKIRHYCNSIIEIHDLITVNKKMRLLMEREVGKRSIVTGNNIDKLLDLEFFKMRNISANKVEYEIYDKYLYTLCISDDEKKEVDANTQRTQAIHLPMTYQVSENRNKYDAEALFCVGPNPFNSQGYYLFVKTILPIIRRQQPEYSMKITGSFYGYYVPKMATGITYVGFLEDLSSTYESARFFVCPVFGGTGQQVKIVEAMAHGLPVVAFASAASRSPIRHGENGLIANSAEEFAEHVLALWSDKSLCRKLGDAARLTIAKQFSQECLLERLASLVG